MVRDAGAGQRWSPESREFRLGPLVVDSDGRVRAEQGTPTCFTIRWRGRPTSARLHADGRLDLAAAVARVPSSASMAADGLSRENSFVALRGVPALLPASWRLVLRPDHQVGIEAERRIAVPVSAEELLTELTMFLLELDPYLPLFEAEGLQGGGSQAAGVTPPRQVSVAAL